MKSITFNTKSGKLAHSFHMTEWEFQELDDTYSGACVWCGETAQGDTEPDARKYRCASCDKPGVYGAQELLLMGFISLTDDEAEESENV